ncbi:MAG: hypothetical protein JWM80_2908 [Cyanobacteria bacterium RYN_339]|nr:hypothetical protein [Cyanobacteria bacterium RYN_339]
MIRGTAAAVTLLLVLTAPVQAAEAGDAGQEDAILVEVRVDQLTLAESLGARPAPDGGLRLPLGELARALGLAIEVQPAAGTASGFVLREDRRFQLDLGAGTASLGGRALPIDEAWIDRQPDDLYIDTRELARWLPIGFDYDTYNLIVRLQPSEPLPAQLRLERERRAEAGGDAAVNPDYPLVRTPYGMVGDPAVDPSLGFTWTRDDAGVPHPGLTYSVFGNTDVAGLDLAAYAAGTESAWLSDWHLTLGRKDPDGTLLGPLGARDVALGYVLDPGLNLVAGTWTGNGALLSSFPLTQPARFDRQSFRGPLPPGWDAQLYQNAYPIAYQAAGSVAEYRFDDVPLVVGPNEFRIVLNGPQGQRREDIRRFNIGATLVPAGDHRYRVVQGLALDGRERMTMTYEQGLTGSLSVATGFARLPLVGGDTRQFGTAGLRGTLGEVFWHTDAAADALGGLVAEVGAQATAGLMGLSLNGSVLKGFTSEAFLPGPDPIAQRANARFDARTPDTFVVPAAFVLTSSVDRHLSGTFSPLIGNQISAHMGPVNATHVLNIDPSSGGPFNDATFQLSSQLRDVQVRGECGYTPHALTTVGAAASGQAFNEVRWTVGGAYQLAERQPQVTVDLNHAFGIGTVGVTATYAYPAGATAGLTFSGGLGWAAGGLRPSAISLSTSGTARVSAFQDANMNNHRDPGERAIAGLTLDVGGQAARTDADGNAAVTGLAAYTPADVDFTKVSLDDPLLVPALKGTRFVPRPGRTTLIELPIIAVGEIYGTVRTAGRDLGGVTLELVDASGKVVATTVGGMDGYFALTEVRPGRYTLRVDPAQAAKLHYRQPPTRPVLIPGEGAVFDGQDFLLEAEAP